MFEYHALRQKEEIYFKIAHTTLRKTIVSTLGLNLLRPAAEDGMPKKDAEMTEEEREMYMPLVAWCGRPEMLKDVQEQYELEAGFDKAANPDSEYERQVAAIDAAGGDMEPIVQVVSVTGKLLDPRAATQEKLLVQPVVDVNGKV